MAINRKNPLFEDDLSMRIPIVGDQAFGRLEGMGTGGGWHRWKWSPNDKKRSPVITVTPKTGYQFVGFEIDTEWKENGSSIEKFYENRGRLSTNGIVSLHTAEIKHIVAGREQNFDWENQLVKYTAIVNKNIYDIVIKPEFCDAQGEPIKGVAEISGITVDIQNTTQDSNYKFKYINSRTSINKDITKDQMLDGSFYSHGNANRKVLFTKEATEWFSNTPVKVGEVQVIPAKQYARLIKNNDYILDDHFKMTAEITKVARYDFEGFYINGTKIGNHSETKSQDGSKFTYELSSVLDAAFLENTAYGIDKHANDQIVVTAKFNLGGGNFYAKWNEDEATAAVGDGGVYEATNPDLGWK